MVVGGDWVMGGEDRDFGDVVLCKLMGIDKVHDA